MKQLFLAAALFTTVFSHNALARPATPVNAQPGALSPILTAYYSVKDALITGDAKAVAAAAAQLLQTINSVNKSTLPQKDQQAFKVLQDKLAFDSRHISESTDINHQREHFTSLSANLFTLAKQAHLSQQPIYEDYCPMKKAYWLSSDQAIKNPYFGNSMLTCGKVSATLQP